MFNQARFFHPPTPKGAKTLFPTGKAAGTPGLPNYFGGVGLARGAYREYVSANGAKSAKAVSPEVTKHRERCWRTL